jgi:HTH-type transcriptional regulator/antitoxin HigA
MKRINERRKPFGGTVKSVALKPARVFNPGRLLKNELEARGWKQKHFADLIGRPVQYVSELIHGKRQLTVEAARELEAALGTSAHFWLSLEVNYRLWLVEQAGESAKLAGIRDRVAKNLSAYAG